MGFSCDNKNTGSCALDGYPGYDGFLMMFAIACSTFVGAAPPGGVAAWKRTLQLMASATQLATALLSELNVASVVVSVPFGRGCAQRGQAQGATAAGADAPLGASISGAPRAGVRARDPRGAQRRAPGGGGQPCRPRRRLRGARPARYLDAAAQHHPCPPGRAGRPPRRG